MQVHRDPNNLPKFINPVVTIGSFDGVHRAHLKILDRVLSLADEIDGESILVTFHPHPRKIIFPKDDTLQLLNTLEEKLFILKSIGLDHVVIVPFSVEFSQQNPREYIEKFLIDKFNPRYIVIGYDHRFGLNRGGNIELLKQYNEQFGIIQIQRQELEDITISSTKIRNALKEGRIDTANSYLIRPYIIQGKVIHGDKIGKSIGYPTANINVDDKDKLIPKEGIYACYVVIENERYQGMLYIGNRPSLKSNVKPEKRIEVNIFEFKDEIYDQDIRLEVINYIREDEKFDNMRLLTAQLAKDEKAARTIFDIEYEEPIESSNCTVAILNYNGEHYLESYLPTVLYSSTALTNYTVIDNGSTDGSLEYLEDWHPEVELVRLTKNYGFAGGYNRGLKHVDSKYTVILNSDVIVEKYWLDPIFDMMNTDKEIGIVQPKILSLEKRNEFEYAGAAGGWLDTLGYPFCRGRIFDALEEDNGQYNTTEEVFWASGAAMVVRTKLFKALGGFDKDYFAHMEEIDFCWRVKRAGYKVMICANSTVYHLGGGTLDYGNPHKTFLNFRNNLNTLLKNESISALLWKFPLRLILDGVAGIKFLVSGNTASTVSILKSHFSVYRSMAHTLRKRVLYNRLIKGNRINHESRYGRYSGSILIAYYLKGRKKFNEIVSNKS